MTSKPHFQALLTFLASNESNRSTPVSSGFRPEIKFHFDQKLVRGKQNFVDIDLVFPGDVVNAEITLLSDEDFVSKLYSGLDFDFFDGSVLIGHGIVTKLP